MGHSSRTTPKRSLGDNGPGQQSTRTLRTRPRSVRDFHVKTSFPFVLRVGETPMRMRVFRYFHFGPRHDRLHPTMTYLNFHRRARATLWLAAIVLLFAALSPTLHAWRAEGQPKQFTELCTSMGFVKVAVDDNGMPATQTKHGPECAWCLSPASLLSMPGADTLQVPADIGREPAPILVSQLYSLSRHHAFAWAQAPPTFPDH